MEEHSYIICCIHWCKGSTYDTIAQWYVAHVMKNQTGSCIGVTVNFTEDMELLKMDEKQKFILILSGKLQGARCEMHHAENDADHLIVQTVVAASKRKVTVVVGDNRPSAAKAVSKREPCMISQAVPRCIWVKSLSTYIP